ncbi:LysR family transcriptional regulator [Nesterenkonia sp. HG001]|uniref:LysR family transcriptional regulator n=1 Tax=Nesterenkonia sp. HG001 TaxID=2983207 RepID=UPI002AC47D6F|nr:LysR family transcriptional regulator [Nesterenkonia sp. HG001]MDZ5077113.1 LysR family transcriptional regulator [Nesterenkonia sp. HG001]
MIDSRLQLLIAVCEHGTVTAAAEALYRTPSGVSRQLKELAQELDVDLLERHGRRVRLTPAGRRLVTHARTLNAQWETALGDVTAAARELCGPISIGGFPTAISAIITPALIRLRARHHQLRPIVKEIYSRQLIAALESGTIDLGLFVADESTSHLTDSHIDVTGLLDDPIDLLVPRDHRFAAAGEIQLEEAAQEDWITGHPHQDAYTELLSATRAVGYAPRVAHFAQELTATTALVAAGAGIAAVPRIAMTIPHPHVVQIPLSGAQVPRRRIMLAQRRGSAQNPRIAAAITALEHHTGSSEPAEGPHTMNP